ncbi:MAG: 2-phosphosulfolactate phosphatase [Planctomycetota bacterium]
MSNPVSKSNAAKSESKASDSVSEPDAQTEFVLDVALLPSMVSPESLTGKTVIVVDVLRATTTIATALNHGCCGVLPQSTIEAARAKFKLLETADETQGRSLIGGERGGKIVEGFHHGNSPIEYTPEVIAGKHLILTTTNGTVAMEQCRLADRVLIGSMVNLTAIANAVLETAEVTVLCSGTDRLMTSEDVLFAGALLDRLAALREENSIPVGQMTDPAFIAHNHWKSVESRVASGSRSLADFFRNARGGINLARIGHNADIEFAANIDAVPVVPELDLTTWQIQLADS